MARLPFAIEVDADFEAAASALFGEEGFAAISGAARPGGFGFRYSIAASRPIHSIAISGGFVTIDGRTAIDSPRTALSAFLVGHAADAGDQHLPFAGGAIGYIGFEGCRAISGLEPAPGFSRYPQCAFGIYDAAFVFDRIEGIGFAVASCGRAEESERKARALKERIESHRPSPGGRRREAPSASGVRLIPDDAGFGDLLEDAMLWLRSEAAERLHIARHAAIPSCASDALREFLSPLEPGSSRAIFSHSGAFAVVSSRKILLSIEGGREARAGLRARREDCAGLIPSLLPLADFAGRPIPKAVSFIDRHECRHRGFYGGAFGFMDALNASLMPACGATCYADGASYAAAGCDMTAASDPSRVISEISQALAFVQRN